MGQQAPMQGLREGYGKASGGLCQGDWVLVRGQVAHSVDARRTHTQVLQASTHHTARSSHFSIHLFHSMKNITPTQGAFA